MRQAVQKMGKFNWILIAFLLIIANVGYSGITISDIEIIPSQPTNMDIVGIQVFGGMTSLTFSFEKSILTFSDKQINLDLYFTSISGPLIPFPWSHTETVGVLSTDNYDVTVSVYSKLNTDYILQDSYPASFQVIPEPSALSLFGAGILLFRKIVKTKLY